MLFDIDVFLHILNACVCNMHDYQGETPRTDNNFLSGSELEAVISFGVSTPRLFSPHLSL